MAADVATIQRLLDREPILKALASKDPAQIRKVLMGGAGLAKDAASKAAIEKAVAAFMPLGDVLRKIDDALDERAEYLGKIEAIAQKAAKAAVRDLLRPMFDQLDAIEEAVEVLELQPAECGHRVVHPS